jgi:hypothetical protein
MPVLIEGDFEQSSKKILYSKIFSAFIPLLEITGTSYIKLTKDGTDFFPMRCIFATKNATNLK